MTKPEFDRNAAADDIRSSARSINTMVHRVISAKSRRAAFENSAPTSAAIASFIIALLTVTATYLLDVCIFGPFGAWLIGSNVSGSPLLWPIGHLLFPLAPLFGELWAGTQLNAYSSEHSDTYDPAKARFWRKLGRGIAITSAFAAFAFSVFSQFLGGFSLFGVAHCFVALGVAAMSYYLHLAILNGGDLMHKAKTFWLTKGWKQTSAAATAEHEAAEAALAEMVIDYAHALVTYNATYQPKIGIGPFDATVMAHLAEAFPNLKIRQHSDELASAA